MSTDTVAYWLTTLLADGESGWLNLLVLVSIWSGIKMLWLGRVSLVMLARVRAPGVRGTSPPDEGRAQGA